MKELDRLASFKSTEKMPILFLGHGSPMNAIEENEFVQGFRLIGQQIPRPNAILCVSAHWETSGTHVTAMQAPRTIHDFGGFPRQLFSVQYPAAGSPELARDLQENIKDDLVSLDDKWGLDHGCWSVVKHLYPKADIPVVQMSLDYHKTPAQHYGLARQLSALREKGVLIIGSGNMVHNLSKVAWNRLNESGFGFDWAIEASDKMKEYITNDNHQALIDYESQGEAFKISIPTPDHYLPLLYTLALKRNNDEVNLFNDKAVGGSLTMTSVRVG